jgi:DNA-3-methyladenine glycosylase
VSAIQPDWLSRSSLLVAPDLLGCTIVRQLDDSIVRGLIVETEAYTEGDPACHAYRRQTPRNKVMFGPAGMTYVYLIYGMYHCLNVVTDLDGIPSAVLIRALQLETIPPGCPPERLSRIAAGPGKLCRALKIDLTLTAKPLQPGESLWLEPRSQDYQEQLDRQSISFIQTTRIGLTQGADLPWRWYVKGCAAVSKKG